MDKPSMTDPLQEMGRRILRDRFGIHESLYRVQTYMSVTPDGVDLYIYYRLGKHGVKRRVDARLEVTQVGNFATDDSGPLVRV